MVHLEAEDAAAIARAVRAPERDQEDEDDEFVDTGHSGNPRKILAL